MLSLLFSFIRILNYNERTLRGVYWLIARIKNTAHIYCIQHITDIISY